MSSAVGLQALVAALPMVLRKSGDVFHLQHRTGVQGVLPASIRKLIDSEQVSEVLVIDAAGEGKGKGFNVALLEAVQAHTDLPLLAFGGLARAEQIRPLLCRPQLAGVVLANALNYREHAIGHLKSALTDQPLRPHNLR